MPPCFNLSHGSSLFVLMLRINEGQLLVEDCQTTRECRELVEEAEFTFPSPLQKNRSPIDGNSKTAGSWRQGLVWFYLKDAWRVLLRSQHEPLASCRTPNFKGNAHGLSAFPDRPLPQTPSASPLSHVTCQCSLQLDVFGHHRAACPEAGPD